MKKQKKTRKDNSALKKIGTKARSITLGFLDILLSVAEGTIRMSMDKKEAYRIAHGHFENEWNCDRIAKFFYDLKKRGYIDIEKKSGGESIVFTNKTKIALLEQSSARKPNDQCYRYISFDIPEPMTRQRDAFRRSIKRIGFRQVQKSLWVINRDVSDLVEMAAKEYGVEEYVIYIIGEKSDVDLTIAKILKGKKN